MRQRDSLARRLIEQAGAEVGVDWWDSVRRDHAQRVADTGLPSRRQENWRYTSLARLDKQELEPARNRGHALQAEDMAPFGIPDWPAERMVFINGFFVPELSCLPDSMDLRVTSLRSVDDPQLEGFRPLLERQFQSPESAFAALNTAIAVDGALIEVAAGAQPEHPLECIYLTLPEEQALACHLRNMIILGEGARLSLVERFVSMGEPSYLSNCVNQFRLSEGARLTHVRLQQESSAGSLITRTDVEQSERSHYEYCGIDLGGNLVRHDINVSLEGSDSAASVAGLYALDGERHVDNHVRMDHRSRDARSETFFKGVMGDRSRAVFNGKVVVQPGADGTDASQTNRNLLLSRQAEVDTKPELEIYADDVKCAHGATVGQLDEDQMFYLRSRGISQDDARVLLIYAFCRQVVDRLESESLRDYVAGQVLGHLPGNQEETE